MDVDRDELFEILTECDKEEHSKWVSAFSGRDNDKSAILTAHLIVEQILESMIKTTVKRSALLLKDKDFRSKVDIVYALGGIGDHELNCCRVLNSARNAIVHDLGPLPEKWKRELKRLTQKKASTGGWRDVKEKDPIKSLYVLLATISNAWVHVKYHHNRLKMREENGDRWIQIYMAKVKEKGIDYVHNLDPEMLNYEIDLELAKQTLGDKKLGERAGTA